jgi:hypothetical protein
MIKMGGGFNMGGWGRPTMIRRAVPFSLSFTMGGQKATLNQGSAS